MIKKLPQPGSTEWHEAIKKLEVKLSRQMTSQELDKLRKEALRSSRPIKGQGKTRARSAKAFAGQGRTHSKRCYVSQLPLYDKVVVEGDKTAKSFFGDSFERFSLVDSK